MTMTSGLSVDLEGDLNDIPLGQNGDITRLEGGGYAVVAEVLGFSFLRVFDASGEPVESFGFAGTNPTITGLPGGGISLVVSTDNTLQVHILDGNLQQTAAGELAFPGISGQSSIASVGDGTFFLANERDFVDRDVILQRIGSNGEAIDDFIAIESVSDIDTSDPDVAVLSNGNVVVTTTTTVVETGVVRLQFHIVDPATGSVQTFTIPDSAGAGGENRHARVVATDDGFAIVYETRVFSFLDRDIRLRTFDLDGVQTDDTLITNSTFGSTGQDDGADDTAPDIAIGPDGSIVVTWTRSNGLDTDQLLQVVGQGGDQVVGFANQGNLQGQPLVTFFGTGQIAAYHFDDSQNALVGQHFSGFRDSFGDDGDDSFTGDDFVDLINGLGGKDTLSGGNNDDTVQGGDGRDSLFGDAGNDLLQGEEGVGTSSRGRHGDRLSGGTGNDTLEGENGNDRLDGGADNDALFGGLDDDNLKGGTGNDALNGDAGADTLDGGQGNDTLAGGLGQDTVTGGAGADQFLIRDATPDNRDQITDFVSGLDAIGLDFQTFFVLGSQVDASELRFGSAAQDDDDFLIYNVNNGRLSFDADANGLGAAVVIANIVAGNTIQFTDILVV